MGTSVFYCMTLLLYHSLWWGGADRTVLWDISVSSILANISSLLEEFSGGSTSILFDCCMLVNFCIWLYMSRSGAAFFSSTLIFYNLKTNALFLLMENGRVCCPCLFFSFLNLESIFQTLPFKLVNLKNKHFFLTDVPATTLAIRT